MIDREVVVDFFWRNFELNYSYSFNLLELKSKIKTHDVLKIDFVEIPIYQIIKYNGEEIIIFTNDFNFKNLSYHIDNEGFIVFNFDFYGNVFWLLSGLLELNSAKDELDRSTFKNSFFAKTAFHFTPLVDYYFEFLIKAFSENNYEIQPKFQRSILVSHDVDILQNLYRKGFKNSILSFNFLEFTKSIYLYFTKKYLEKSFQEIVALKVKYNFKSTYFILPSDSRFLKYQNADYQLDNKYILKILQSLEKDNQLEIHGGFESSINEDIFIQQKFNLERKLNKEISINRFHYLMFDRFKTPQILANCNVKMDSSLGFNDMFGFRNFTSKPFYLFDFESFNTLDVVEVPLIVMDGTLFYEHYLNLKSSKKAFQLIENVLQQVKKVNGILCINWHNDAFYDTQKKEWIILFEMILQWSIKNNFKAIDFQELSKILANDKKNIIY